MWLVSLIHILVEGEWNIMIMPMLVEDLPDRTWLDLRRYLIISQCSGKFRIVACDDVIMM